MVNVATTVVVVRASSKRDLRVPVTVDAPDFIEGITVSEFLPWVITALAAVTSDPSVVAN